MKKNHIHRLKRHKYKNGEAIYFCVKDDCSFKINVELSIGKTAECWRCNKPFPMTVLSKRMDRPHCVNCTKKKSEAPSISLDDIFQSNLPTEIKSNVTDLRSRLQGSIKRGPTVIANDESNSEDTDDML